MQKFTFLRYWFLLIIATSFISGLVYATVQQDLRQGANDPQIQIAEDVASALQNGRSTTNFNTVDKIDITKSLGTFLTIYDNSGKLLG